jgi:pyroglutamyl-peptidase
VKRLPLLLTGFEAFAGLRANPTAKVVRRLARDPDCRAAGVRTAILPVDREAAPPRLASLLQRHRPEALVLCGVAVGRRELCFERIAVNVWRDLGKRGHGEAIRRGAPDGLFATAPLAASVRALKRGGPARVSESAGTYACNLVLYEALLWAREGTPWGGPAPRWSSFIHVPATPGCGAPPGSPLMPSEQVEKGLKALVLELAGRVRG